jgi:hypothetical protein
LRTAAGYFVTNMSSQAHQTRERFTWRSIWSVGSANVASSALTFGALALLGFLLVPNAFISLSASLAFVAIVVNIADAPVTMHRGLALAESSWTRRAYIAWRWVMVVMLTGPFILWPSLSGLSAGVLFAAASLAVATSTFNAKLALFQASRDFRGWGRATVWANGLRAIALVVALLGGLGLVLALYMSAVVMSMMAFLVSSPEDITRVGSMALSEKIRAPFMIASAVVNAVTMRVDVLVAAALLPVTAAADYARYSLLSSALLLLIGSFITLVLPTASSLELNSVELRLLARRCSFSVAAAGFACVAIGLLVPRYGTAVMYLLASLPFIVLAAFTVVISTPMYVHRGGASLAALNALELAVFLLSSYLVHARLGAMALVFGRSLAMLVGSLFVIHVLLRTRMRGTRNQCS